MVNITVTFDPANPADIERTRHLLDQLGSAYGPASLDPETIHQKVIALFRGYGHKRVDYIRAIAQASPERASYETLVAIVGSAKAIGGTHSAIERAWRAKGMSGPFIETDLNGDARMDMKLADIVLFALHEIEEPDLLAASRY